MISELLKLHLEVLEEYSTQLLAYLDNEHVIL